MDEELVQEVSIPKDTTPEEYWTVINASRVDRAKKKIVFTPTNDMPVQNVFTPWDLRSSNRGE